MENNELNNLDTNQDAEGLNTGKIGIVFGVIGILFGVGMGIKERINSRVLRKERKKSTVSRSYKKAPGRN